MANQITGLVKAISEPQTAQSKSGNTYTRQSVYLDCSSFSPSSGEKFENYLLLDFVNLREGDIRQRFLVGQRVDVSFSLRGYTYDGADGKKRHGISVNCYRIDLSANQPRPQYVERPAMVMSAPQPAQGVSTAASTPPSEDDLPF